MIWLKRLGEDGMGNITILKQMPQKAGSRRKDWNQIDAKYLPEVKRVIQQLWGNKEERPKKVTRRSCPTTSWNTSKRTSKLSDVYTGNKEISGITGRVLGKRSRVGGRYNPAEWRQFE